MLFDNPVFAGWYTDRMDIYRTVAEPQGNVTVQVRKKVNTGPVLCRVYSPDKSSPMMTDTAARERGTEKLACDLAVDVLAGDELQVIRGGNLGIKGEPERYIAGAPVPYYDPVGGVLTGLEHKEIGLLKDSIVR